jgi:hypothetical protein
MRMCLQWFPLDIYGRPVHIPHKLLADFEQPSTIDPSSKVAKGIVAFKAP